MKENNQNQDQHNPKLDSSQPFSQKLPKVDPSKTISYMEDSNDRIRLKKGN